MDGTKLPLDQLVLAAQEGRAVVAGTVDEDVERAVDPVVEFAADSAVEFVSPGAGPVVVVVVVVFGSVVERSTAVAVSASPGLVESAAVSGSAADSSLAASSAVAADPVTADPDTTMVEPVGLSFDSSAKSAFEAGSGLDDDGHSRAGAMANSATASSIRPSLGRR